MAQKRDDKYGIRILNGTVQERHQPAYIDGFGGVGCALNEDCTIDREVCNVDDFFVGSIGRAREFS